MGRVRLDLAACSGRGDAALAKEMARPGRPIQELTQTYMLGRLPWRSWRRAAA
jgi:hypothetical protein